MKKKKHKNKKNQSQQLSYDAQRLFELEQFKKAIPIYKQLLKEDPNQELQRKLGGCYLKRAESLAEKKLYKEAVVMWEMSSKYTNESQQNLVDYICWLFYAGEYVKATLLYLQYYQHIKKSTNIFLIQEHIAALLLSNNEKIKDILPMDSSFICEYKIIQQAIELYSYSDNNPSEYLSSIPYRSPYRNIVQIIKACYLIDKEPEKALILLKKVPKTSLFSFIARTLSYYATNDFSQKISNISKEEWYSLGELYNWDRGVIDLLTSLIRIGNKASHHELFRWIISNLSKLNKADAQESVYLLIHHSLKDVQKYKHHFGDLPPGEIWRIRALTYEKAHAFDDTYSAWKKYEEILSQIEQNEQIRLKRALIFKHLAILYMQVDRESRDPRLIQLLENSLDIYPKDKEVHLELIRQYHKRDKKSGLIIDRALKYFPDDKNILMLAIEAAEKESNFKKTINFAEKILSIDPINIDAKLYLTASYLSEAKRMAVAKKIVEAKKTLDQIEHKKGFYADLIELNYALLLYAEGRLKTARIEIANWLAKANNPIKARFQLFAEANQQNHDLRDLGKILNLEPISSFENMEHIKGLLNYLREYTNRVCTNIQVAINKLETPFRNMAKVKMELDDRLVICQLLLDLKYYRFLKYYAEYGQRDFGSHYAIMYYYIYSKYEGEAEEISDKDFDLLNDAVEKAKDEKDFKIKRDIATFLSESNMPSFPNFNPRRLFELLDYEEDYVPNFIPDEEYHPVSSKKPKKRKKKKKRR